MLTQSSIRLWLIGAALAIFNAPAWCQSRHIDVKAVDEHERPLVDATVMISLLPEPPEFLGDVEHLDEGTALKRVFAQTNASGAAKVDVTTLDAVAPDQPLRVIVSKKGYGLQTVTAQKQARIRCLPVLKRRFQILDAEGRPVAGLKVQHQLGERVAAADEAKLAWCALEAYKQGQITAGQLRQVAEASLLSHHPDAGSLVRQANILIVRAETPRERISDDHNEIHAYQAACRISPELGRQQAWLLARDYLSGRYEVNAMNIMPTQSQLANRSLAIAYCLTDEHPQLAQQIARLGVPRVLNNLERNFEQRNWDATDMTMVAWFEPQATCDLLIKLNKRYTDELQQQNAQPVAQPGQPGQQGADTSRLLYMANDIAALRHACLRGLLLDEL